MLTSKAKQNKIRFNKLCYENKNKRQTPLLKFATKFNLIFKSLGKCIRKKALN